MQTHETARACLNGPHVGECALEVPSQNELDASAGVVPPDQTFREIEDLLCVVDPVKVEFPRGMRRSIPSVQIDVASYTNVLHSGQFGHVVNMVQHICDRGAPALSLIHI